jgi:hypothetical protein
MWDTLAATGAASAMHIMTSDDALHLSGADWKVADEDLMRGTSRHPRRLSQGKSHDPLGLATASAQD